MQFRSTRNGLAWLLVDAKRLEAVEKMVETILQMDRPRDVTVLKGFIGAVEDTFEK